MTSRIRDMKDLGIRLSIILDHQKMQTVLQSDDINSGIVFDIS